LGKNIKALILLDDFFSDLSHFAVCPEIAIFPEQFVRASGTVYNSPVTADGSQSERRFLCHWADTKSLSETRPNCQK
jgi:hypothetical protein